MRSELGIHQTPASSRCMPRIGPAQGYKMQKDEILLTNRRSLKVKLSDTQDSMRANSIIYAISMNGLLTILVIYLGATPREQTLQTDITALHFYTQHTFNGGDNERKVNISAC